MPLAGGFRGVVPRANGTMRCSGMGKCAPLRSSGMLCAEGGRRARSRPRDRQVKDVEPSRRRESASDARANRSPPSQGGASSPPPGRAWQWHGHCSSIGLGRGYGVKTAAKGEGCFRRPSEAEGWSPRSPAPGRAASPQATTETRISSSRASTSRTRGDRADEKRYAGARNAEAGPTRQTPAPESELIRP